MQFAFSLFLLEILVQIVQHIVQGQVIAVLVLRLGISKNVQSIEPRIRDDLSLQFDFFWRQMILVCTKSSFTKASFVNP